MEDTFSFEDVVNWLLRSHIHLMICYPHEGSEKFGWDVINIAQQLQRLRFHVGYPMGEYCQCPIMTQDKYTYLEAVVFTDSENSG